MSSIRQIEANRRNALLSTGPRTVRGKAISSMNALKHGIFAESSVLPGEDGAAFAALTEQFYQDCQPQTPVENELVDKVVHDTWLLRRFARIESRMHEARLIDDKVRESGRVRR